MSPRERKEALLIINYDCELTDSLRRFFVRKSDLYTNIHTKSVVEHIFEIDSQDNGSFNYTILMEAEQLDGTDLMEQIDCLSDMSESETHHVFCALNFF